MDCPMKILEVKPKSSDRIRHKRAAEVKECKIMLNRVDGDDGTPPTKMKAMSKQLPDLKPLSQQQQAPASATMLISPVPLPQLPVEPILIKPIERRRAPPQQKFPTDDSYIPDNNSNNVMNKDSIDPPPNEAERAQGFCQRQLRDGQSRLICISCGKNYTTMYNMRQHRNIHTGKNLYTCRYCGKSFTHKHIWEVSSVDTKSNVPFSALYS